MGDPQCIQHELAYAGAPMTAARSLYSPETVSIPELHQCDTCRIAPTSKHAARTQEQPLASAVRILLVPLHRGVFLLNAGDAYVWYAGAGWRVSSKFRFVDQSALLLRQCE